MVTSWPASANTWAMPWPISPAPTTAMRGLLTLPRRVAAVGVEDVAGVEIRCARREKQQRAGEVGRLAEPSLGHAGEEALAHFAGALGVLVHPRGQRRTEDGRPQRVDGDAGLAQLAAQRLGDAVHRGLRRAVRCVPGRMAQQAASRGGEDDLAAEAVLILALLEHLPGSGARHQP